MPSTPRSDAAPLHYDEIAPVDAAADGPPLIALAGGAARHPAYLGTLGGLDARHRLIVPHLRGVGRTPLPQDAEAASFWRQAHDIDRLRVHLGLDAVRLIAHSAGTRLAISYAAQFPDRVASLILVTPPAAHLLGMPAGTESLIRRRQGEPAFDEAVAAWENGPQRHDDEGFTQWFITAAPMSYAAWGAAEQSHARIGGYSFAANRAYFSVEPPGDILDRMRTLRVPVLVVAGAEDCGGGVAPAAALADLFARGELAVIDGSGHYPWVEQPTAFRDAVDGFLARYAPS